ncbi:MAG: DUF1080 domain-containing protein [Planctomycetota bacterium]
MRLAVLFLTGWFLLLVSPQISFALQEQEEGQASAEQEAVQEEAAGDEGVVVLFDGSSLDHFRGYHNEEIGAGWSIEEGMLKFDGSGGGDIITREQFGNFELTFEWMVTEGANSGVMYRVSTGDGAPYFSGAEYQILDDDQHRDGGNVLTSAGSLYAMYAPENKTLQPVGEWNEAKIVLNGATVEHWLNGVKVVEAELGSEDWNTRLAASKFKDWEKFARNESGHIAFQDHGDTVFYRNIVVRPIVEENDSGEAAGGENSAAASGVRSDG